MTEPKKGNKSSEKDIFPASFDEMSNDEMRVLLREYQIKLEEQDKQLVQLQENYNKTIPHKVTAESTDLTDESQLLKTLRDSEYFFKESQRAAAIGSYSADFTTGYWISSEVLDQIFGIDESYNRSIKGWIDIVHPEDREMMATYLKEDVLGNHQPFNKEYRITHISDGETRWVLGKGEVTFDENGNVTKLIGTIHDITERKLANEALLAAKEDWKNTFDSLTDMITIHDTNFKIIAANNSARELLSLDPTDDITDIKCYQCYHNLDAPPENCPCCISSKTMQSCLTEIFEPNLNKYLEVRVIPRFDSNQQYIGLIHVVRDITERKRIENELQESEYKYRSLIHHSSDPIFSFNLDGTYRFVNEAFAKVFAMKPDEIMGKTPHFIFPYDEAERRLTMIRKIIACGDKGEIEVMVVTATGETRYLLTMLDPVKNENGEVLYVTCISKDITERKNAEASLRASEARQGKMVANIGDVITIIDRNGINQYKSPNIERWFGWKPEELVGQNALDNIHPDDREKTIKFIADLMAEPNASGTIECRYICKNGSYKWIEFTGFNLIDDPDINGLLGNYQDITKRKRAEEEKSKLEAQLHHALKMESVGRLAGGVAHDFNNMLQAILGNADIAIELTPENSPVRESLNEICTAAERSADLTRQLLAFARKQTIAPKVLDLNKTVASILKMLQRLIGENIDLSWVPRENLWPIKVDPSQIDQILSNMCVNARDAINGVGKIIIETTNRDCDESYCANHVGFIPGNYVQLTISDDGCGMEKEIIDQIFEPFFTTKGIGEGTGLGLATVYGAVRQNNGFIITYSEPGKGTSFNIYLPRFIGKSEQLGDNIKDEEISRGKETILICEDDPTIMKLTRTMLQRLGYNVLAANNPGNAVRIAAEYNGNIHLLITDVIMPEMNGRDLARNILSIYPGIKRLFMSGYTSDIITHHGVLENGVNFLQKPFSLKNLSTMVRESLDKELS